jgi:hypothetical protein
MSHLQGDDQTPKHPKTPSSPFWIFTSYASFLRNQLQAFTRGVLAFQAVGLSYVPVDNFVFDNTAEGRSIKNLMLVNDATNEAVGIVPERAIGGNQLVHIVDQLATTRVLPKAIRTDRGKEFCSRAMLN